MRRAITTAALWAVLTAAAGALAADPVPPVDRLDPTAPPLNITVEDPWEGRGGTTMPGRRLCIGSGIQYVPSAALGRLVPLSRYWDVRERRLKLRVGLGEALVTAGSRLVVVDGSERLMPVPAWALDGDLWVPVDFVVDVLGPLSGRSFVWDPQESVLLAGGASANVQSVRVEASSRQTRVRLSCTETLSWRLEDRRDGSYALKVYGGALVAGASRRLRPAGLVEAVVARQDPDRLVVEFTPQDVVSNVRVVTEDAGRTLVAVLEERPGDLPDLKIRGERSMGDAKEFRSSRKVRTIVLDPGHGGADAGVSVRGRPPEKEITLALADGVRRVLQDAGYTVVLTRESDRALGPDARSERANLAGGDLFVSLHCNGWHGSSARGVEAWFLSGQTLDDAVGGGDFLPWDRVQQLHVDRSAVLAERLLNGVDSRTDLPKRGVRQARLPVLQGLNMPAVLLEVGFLTHERDAAVLTDGDARRDLARGIGRAILDVVEGGR